MYNEDLRNFSIISKDIGNKPEYVQGGGGNTSVKFNEELMAIKASGFRLNQITQEEGFVVVNYKNIREYFENSKIDLEDSGIDYDKDSVEFAKNNIVEYRNISGLRPSVEVGFHSVLKKYVIHTHSVYSNIVCCSREGKELVERIFSDKKWNVLWIPYVKPGFFLTLKIMNAVKDYREEKGAFPNVIFMENHGVIATDNDKDFSIKLHEEINNLIKTYLRIEGTYPTVVVEKSDQETYVSNTKYIKEGLKDIEINSGYFDKIVLYPDQLVYLNDNISVDSEKTNRLNISTKTGKMVYYTNYQEALAIEETLLAYIYVIKMIKESGLEIKTMAEEEANYIKGWESEKYRKTIIR